MDALLCQGQKVKKKKEENLNILTESDLVISLFSSGI